MTRLRQIGSSLRRLRDSRTVQLFLVATIGYWIIGMVLTPDTSNLEFENVIRASLAAAVAIAYLPVCFEAVMARSPDRVQQLSLGIVLSWASTLMVSVWYTAYRYSGRPVWMMDANVYGYMVYLQILGGVLHITAPGAAGKGIPRRNWIILGVSTGIALFLVLIFMVYEPNLKSVVDWLEKWFRSYPDPRGVSPYGARPDIPALPPPIR